MKKKGIRILLALLLSSIMILGTAGIAAGGPPNRVFTVELTPIAGTGVHAGETLLRASIYWDGYRSYGYHAEWYQFESGAFVLKDEPTDNTLSFRTTGSPVITYYGPDHDVSNGEIWQVRVQLLKKNGSVSKRPAMVWNTITVNLAYYEEDFTGYTSGQLPPGWTGGGNYTNRIYVDNWDAAGGSAPELEFTWGLETYNETYYIYTPSINATMATSTLELSFKHLLLYYTDETPPVSPPYSISVDVSTNNGTTWGATSFAYNPTVNIGPETANVDLGAYKGNTINIRWRISGYTYWTDGWYIDDIVVSGS